MKIAICCIVKNENLYLREWIEYHKNLGVDNIILIDNNNIDGEMPQYVIQDYIDNGYVKYINKRGVKILKKHIEGVNGDEDDMLYSVQMSSYREIYLKERLNYDYIFFIDIDEFITLDCEESFKTRLLDVDHDAKRVFFTWNIIGDCNNLYYSQQNIRDRFVQDYNNFPLVCFKFGIKCDNTDKYDGDDNDVVFFFNENIIKLNHYYTKSISEFMHRKLSCGYANNEKNLTPETFDEYVNEMLNIFSSYNVITEEKREIANKIIEQYRPLYTKKTEE